MREGKRWEFRRKERRWEVGKEERRGGEEEEGKSE